MSYQLPWFVLSFADDGVSQWEGSLVQTWGGGLLAKLQAKRTYEIINLSSSIFCFVLVDWDFDIPRSSYCFEQ